MKTKPARRHRQILYILSLSFILSLLVLIIPAAPALAAPILTVSPTSGAVGTRITIDGANFDSYKGDAISIFFNNVEIANSPIIVPETGAFQVEFNIADDATPGISRVKVRGENDSIITESLFTIRETEIQLNTQEGIVGAVVTIDGEGFYSNKTITFYYHNHEVVKLGTKVASPTGEFSHQLTIPESATGEHKITAENTQGNSAVVEFTIIPSMTLEPTSGTVGETLFVNGTGFGYKSAVDVFLDKTKVADIKTDGNGSFQAIFNVPIMQSGTYKIRVKDEDENTGKVDFNIITEAKLDRTTGFVGTELIISGTGYTPNGKVTIKYDTSEIATAIADRRGDFSIAFNAPVSNSGTHMITVSDGIHAKQFDFSMESEAPPVPKQLLPKLGDKIEPPAHFFWEEVDDPSLPITYYLQVALDKDFNEMIIQELGLDTIEYSVTEVEMLEPSKQEPYYWRVKAVDSAGNESKWSSASSVYIRPPFSFPAWAVYILIAIGVLAVIFLAFYLGRRTAYYTPEEPLTTHQNE